MSVKMEFDTNCFALSFLSPAIVYSLSLYCKAKGKAKGKVHLYSFTVAALAAAEAQSSQTGPAYILCRSPSQR